MPQTPLRRQYLQVKRRFPEAIVLFRLGDFYETFDEDARVASSVLGITLTSRELGKGNRHPMAGIPYHALHSYLARLINEGYKVAICEQLTEPAPGKGLVEREVVRVVTPGTVVEPNLLEQKANSYLLALVPQGEQVGLAYVDITTSEFASAQLSQEEVAAELGRLAPREIIAPRSAPLPEPWRVAPVTGLEERWFELETARELLLSHFQSASLEAYGCNDLPLAVRAAGAILHYLGENQKAALAQLTRLATYSTQGFMQLDLQTRRNLDLFQSSRSGAATHSLLWVLDKTRTPMGGRLLKRWLGQPLLDLEELGRRQEAVEFLYAHPMECTRVASTLGEMGDLERIVNRIRGGIAGPRELVALRRHLELLPRLRAEVETAGDVSPVARLLSGLKPCQEVADLIARAIVDNPPAATGDEYTVRPGFSGELDELRSASRNARDYLANLERRERERTGIKTLKVGFNRVFGYYLEVSKPNLKQVPPDYIRKQTLTDAERFYTPELKEHESLILSAQERIQELESSLFRQVCSQVSGYAEQVLGIAAAVARLDVLAALAEVASRCGYVRPQLTGDDAIDISGGRHPVVERTLPEGTFVPNDTSLSSRDCQVALITGPNMSGKSTYLRQVALIVLMAQIGSFVPAQSATIGLVDRVFTRVGLQDDLATGRSTFMVEMLETASILNQATRRSLLILDEIGRGTSTYDGLSIARAVVEYIHNHPRLGSRTLFATHYHELVELARLLPRVKNYNVAVAEEDGRISFLHKIVPGGADRSYGVHVAQLAGLPRPVVNRARELLRELESSRRDHLGRGDSRARRHQPGEPAPQQMQLFGASPPWLEELLQMDVSSMTPLEAITRLYELQERAKDSQS